MTMESGLRGHLQDEDLVLLLDGEAGVHDRTAWSSHADNCLSCSERLDELRYASDWMAENYLALDAGVEIDELARARALSAVRAAVRSPTRSRQPWAGRAAAAVVLIVASGLLVNPVRAWVLDRIAGDDRASAPVVERLVDNAALRQGATIGFTPVQSTFTIEVDNYQQTGSLVIVSSDAAGASAQVSGGWVDESLAVLPAGLMVGNQPGSTADYSVELPESVVRNVRILVAGERYADIDLADVDASILLPLARPAER